MTDRKLDMIHIKDMPLRCVIGIYDEERLKKQDVIVNITMYADLARAAASDDIADTIDYKTIEERISSMVKKSQFHLVERLAAEVAQICLGNRAVQKVDVRIDKPGALSFARSVAVEITRENG